MAQEPFDNPGAWARFRNWLSHVHFRIVTIEDTPHSIALGVAIGIFFGFTPLWSLKTLLSIAVAWLCKSNKIGSRDQRPVARSDPAVYAGDLSLGIQVWLLDDAWSPAPAAPFSGPGLPRLCPLADTLFSRSAAAHRLAHHWIAIGDDRLFCLPRPGYEPPGRANERVGD